MITDNFTGYGMRDGKLLFIADVPRGVACRCICACCAQTLVAKKGSIRRHHFAHFEVTSCHGAAESVLHLLAKELMAELDVFVVPPYEFVKHRKPKFSKLVKHQVLVAKGGRVRIDNVRVEKNEGDFVPDIIIESGSKSLIVEVAVTHKVARTKLRRLRRRNWPAIEIKLGPEDAFLSREQLKQKLQQDLPSKSWLFHPAQREAEREFFAKFRKARWSSWTVGAISRASPASREERKVPFGPRDAGLPSGTECDKRTDEFLRKHDRYPSLEECKWLWSSHNAPQP